jgi:hypothetical protein
MKARLKRQIKKWVLQDERKDRALNINPRRHKHSTRGRRKYKQVA